MAEKEVENIINNGNVQLLSNLFLKRLEFGTAGLRGRMGPGYSQMNDLVIIQTGQGLTKYLLTTMPDLLHKGVIIGYDGRHNSKRFINNVIYIYLKTLSITYYVLYNHNLCYFRFAELTAAIFIANNIKVYLFSKVCPTPFIPYGVLQYKCAAGIMITASHNPKDDNGYKVYWDNGAQIVSPHDKEIQKKILENLEPSESSWNTSKVYESPLYKDPLNDIMVSYFENIKENVLYPEVNKNTILKFTYTAMHGVGNDYMTAAFNAVNVKVFIKFVNKEYP